MTPNFFSFGTWGALITSFLLIQIKPTGAVGDITLTFAEYTFGPPPSANNGAPVRGYGFKGQKTYPAILTMDEFIVEVETAARLVPASFKAASKLELAAAKSAAIPKENRAKPLKQPSMMTGYTDDGKTVYFHTSLRGLPGTGAIDKFGNDDNIISPAVAAEFRACEEEGKERFDGLDEEEQGKLRPVGDGYHENRGNCGEIMVVNLWAMATKARAIGPPGGAARPRWILSITTSSKGEPVDPCGAEGAWGCRNFLTKLGLTDCTGDANSLISGRPPAPAPAAARTSIAPASAAPQATGAAAKGGQGGAGKSRSFKKSKSGSFKGKTPVPGGKTPKNVRMVRRWGTKGSTAARQPKHMVLRRAAPKQSKAAAGKQEGKLSSTSPKKPTAGAGGRSKTATDKTRFVGRAGTCALPDSASMASGGCPAGQTPQKKMNPKTKKEELVTKINPKTKKPEPVCNPNPASANTGVKGAAKLQQSVGKGNPTGKQAVVSKKKAKGGRR
ncbi:hypothetical protein DFH27DRAFT_656492 [Peziza echinospora]|nr:hypothetical protein DFH27DRAFT_656492 [Peziza echinospora]